jgi:hypothetical protein
MRDDLNDIKIDGNSDFEIEELATWGTRPLIAILESASTLSGVKGNAEAVYYLIDTALEKAKDFDACIYRLLDERKAESRQERA